MRRADYDGRRLLSVKPKISGRASTPPPPRPVGPVGASPVLLFATTLKADVSSCVRCRDCGHDGGGENGGARSSLNARIFTFIRAVVQPTRRHRRRRRCCRPAGCPNSTHLNVRRCRLRRLVSPRSMMATTTAVGPFFGLSDRTRITRGGGGTSPPHRSCCLPQRRRRRRRCARDVARRRRSSVGGLSAATLSPPLAPPAVSSDCGWAAAVRLTRARARSRSFSQPSTRTAPLADAKLVAFVASIAHVCLFFCC